MNTKFKSFLFSLLYISLASCAGKEQGDPKQGETPPATNVSPAPDEQEETAKDSAPETNDGEAAAKKTADFGKHFQPSREWGSAQENTSVSFVEASDKPPVIGGQEAIVYKSEAPVIAYTFDADGNLYTAAFQNENNTCYSISQYDTSRKLL